MDSGLADSQPMWSTRIRYFLSMHLTQPKVPACSRWGHRVFNQVGTPQPAQAMHRSGQCTQTLRRKRNFFLGSLWILSAKEFVVKRCWFFKKKFCGIQQSCAKTAVLHCCVFSPRTSMSAFWKTTLSVPIPGYFTSSRIFVDSTPDVGKHTTVLGKLPDALALCKSSAGSPSTLWDLVRDCSSSPRISFAILSVTQGLWGSVRQASEIRNRDTHSPNPFTYLKHRCYLTLQDSGDQSQWPACSSTVIITHLCSGKLHQVQHSGLMASLMRYGP